MSIKLIAVNAIYDGRPGGISPGEDFEVKTRQEADRLIDLGAAQEPGKLSVTAELEVEGFEELVKSLKVDQLRDGLKYLGIDFADNAKRAKLQDTFLEACNANPIQADQFFEDLNG